MLAMRCRKIGLDAIRKLFSVASFGRIGHKRFQRCSAPLPRGSDTARRAAPTLRDRLQRRSIGDAGDAKCACCCSKPERFRPRRYRAATPARAQHFPARAPGGNSRLGDASACSRCF